MLGLAIALALAAAPANSADEIVSAPTICADPYAYRPWVRLDIVRDIRAEAEQAKSSQNGG